jgi:hypothetical protein
LPDLPPSLQELYCQNNPQLEIKYPKLFTIKNIIRINYINEINSKERTIKRTKQINLNDILLELYMKRMMHPIRIKAVVGDDDGVDIDALTTAYVETL